MPPWNRPARAPPLRRRRARRGPVAERADLVVDRAELGAVAVAPLEVVAEDLVECDELGAVLFQPGGEALVQLGAGRLRERVVGGVADQQVAEAEPVLAGELRPVGPDQPLADERGQTRT